MKNRMRTRSEHLADFWTSVTKTENCWVWNRAIAKSGYGVFRWFGRARTVHRISYELAYGKIPEGMSILHRCDNRPCMNPEHLFSGTLIDNNADMMKKGRYARGKALRVGKRMKLTEEKVVQIRSDYASGKFVLRELADNHNVAISTIAHVVSNRTWRDL